MQYWPFATSDLHNWKLQTPKFSEKPQGLIDLLDSVLFTHQPTWGDCQQLLQILFTTKERERESRQKPASWFPEMMEIQPPTKPGLTRASP
jgi:hypothetical protein